MGSTCPSPKMGSIFSTKTTSTTSTTATSIFAEEINHKFEIRIRELEDEDVNENLRYEGPLIIVESLVRDVTFLDLPSVVDRHNLDLAKRVPFKPDTSASVIWWRLELRRGNGEATKEWKTGDMIREFKKALEEDGYRLKDYPYNVSEELIPDTPGENMTRYWLYRKFPIPPQFSEIRVKPDDL